ELAQEVSIPPDGEVDGARLTGADLLPLRVPEPAQVRPGNPALRAGMPRVDVERIATSGALAILARTYGRLPPEHLAGARVAEVGSGIVEALLDVEHLQPRPGRIQVAEVQGVSMAEAGGVE